MILGGSSNIFDEAKKQEKKRTKEPLKPKSPPIQKTDVAGKPFNDDELQQMLNRIHHLDDDLQKRMDYICELTGMSRQDINKFLGNPNNFPVDQWKSLQAQKEQLEQKLYLSSSKEEIKMKKGYKEKKQMAKERKGKTLGTRKGWIDMH